MPEYYLSDSVLSQIADILGEEYVECVEEAATYYWVKKNYYSKSDHKKAMNRSLVEVRDHIQSIREILSDGMLIEYMMKVADAKMPRKSGKHIVGKPSAFINRPPDQNEMEELQLLDELCDAAISSQKSGKGRPKDSKDDALHLFINKLCECCEKSNDGPLTLKNNNLLEQLMKVLSLPMQLGGTSPKLVREAIERRRSK